MLKSAKAILSARAVLSSRKMAPPLANGVDSRRALTYTTTALKRWSCQNNGGQLPAIPEIKAIHVYDFDNTLFTTPLPNPQLWSGQTLGFLKSYDCFANGGWWHDPNILACTGKGIEVEEPLGWKGWWNEHIVELVQLSMKQKDALTVLLTGRSEGPFSDLINRIVRSRALEFDLVCLKPEVGPNSQRFSTTMNFKQTFLEDLVFTYNQADEIRVYEDRVKHTKDFRDYFDQLNRSLSANPTAIRKPLAAEVIQVAEESTFLSPITETAEVQRMINAHNNAFSTIGRNTTKSPYGRLKINQMTFFTGYFLSNADSGRLIQYLLTPLLPSGLTESGDLKIMANNILIAPRAAPRPLLAKVGGIGKTVRWRVTATGVYENRIWAAAVSPISDTEVIHTENPEPMVVLAVRKGTRPIEAMRIHSWRPVSGDDALVFDGTVGEKVVLRVDPEEPELDNPYVSNKQGNKRGARNDMPPVDDTAGPPPTGPSHNTSQQPFRGGGGASRQYHNYARHGPSNYGDEAPRRGSGSYGYRGRGRGGRHGRGGGRGRGRGGGDRGGGYGGYRSLDDYGSGGGLPGYDGPPDERGAGGGAGHGPAGGGEPVMNY